VEPDLLEALVTRVEALLQKTRSLKQENRTLKVSLQEKEELLHRLISEKEAAEAGKAEGLQRIEDLLRRIEEEVG
jgi:hypothetical protein